MSVPGQIGRLSRLALLLAAVLLLTVAFVPRAAAFVYWANAGNGTIGRANLDGTGANQSLIGGVGTPCGVAVDAAHIYWANDSGSGAIGRSNLDGPEWTRA
jgi:sugar lactone lactonase YvrE